MCEGFGLIEGDGAAIEGDGIYQSGDGYAVDLNPVSI